MEKSNIILIVGLIIAVICAGIAVIVFMDDSNLYHYRSPQVIKYQFRTYGSTFEESFNALEADVLGVPTGMGGSGVGVFQQTNIHRQVLVFEVPENINQYTTVFFETQIVSGDFVEKIYIQKMDENTHRYPYVVGQWTEDCDIYNRNNFYDILGVYNSYDAMPYTNEIVKIELGSDFIEYAKSSTDGYIYLGLRGASDYEETADSDFAYIADEGNTLIWLTPIPCE
jgi:hypothetical protein